MTIGKGERTRKTFLDAARAVFSRVGYFNAKIGDIADEAGRSPASFYNYFDNKLDLLEAIAVDYTADLHTRIDQPFRSGKRGKDAVADAIANYWYAYREHLGELVGIYQAAMVEDEFYQRWRVIRADGIFQIARGIEDAQSQGYCPDLDPLVAASALSSMIEHFCYVWLAAGGDSIPRVVDDELAIKNLSGLWLHAVYWRPDDEPA